MTGSILPGTLFAPKCIVQRIYLIGTAEVSKRRDCCDTRRFSVASDVSEHVLMFPANIGTETA